MKKILIVDDDELVAGIYRSKLSASGFQAEIAPDAETGLQLLPVFQPDLILLDLVLPGLSGVEMLRQIRAQPAWQRTPVVVFSNTFLPSKVKEAREAGATTCLSKGVSSPKELVETIRAHLEPKPAPLPPGAVPRAKTPAEIEAEAAVRLKLRKPLLDSLPETLAVLRGAVLGAIRAVDEAERERQLRDLHRVIQALTARAGAAGLGLIGQLSEGLEALLRDLRDKPRNINPSTLRTTMMAVDLLALLHDQAVTTGADTSPVPLDARILVVDDEVISRRAMLFALEAVKFRPMIATEPRDALELLAREQFDLIFLDVQMPEMDGFELCRKIRATKGHRETPVVFVTGLSDFEAFSQSSLSGGTDLIAKPFVKVELGVRALIHLLRRRLQEWAPPPPS